MWPWSEKAIKPIFKYVHNNLKQRGFLSESGSFMEIHLSGIIKHIAETRAHKTRARWDSRTHRAPLAGCWGHAPTFALQGRRQQSCHWIIDHVGSLKERQSTTTSGKISVAGNSLLAGLHALCSGTYLAREANPAVLCAPHKLFVSLRYFLLE